MDTTRSEVNAGLLLACDELSDHAQRLREQATNPTGRGTVMPSWEVREDEAGVLDEVICFEPANVHLERMDECAWWLGVTFADGTEIHVNVGAVRQSTVKSFATYWVESPDQDQPDGSTT